MTAVERVLSAARAEIGVTEYPPGTNKVKYNSWYYGKEVSGASYPWCCVFVCWVFHQAGLDGLVRRTGGCTTLMNWFKNRGQLVDPREARPGDVAFFQFDKDAYADHVGIVERATADGVYAIEGNTSRASNDNGGAVMRRFRSRNCIMAVGRPAYETGKEECEVTEEKVKEMIDQAFRAYEARQGTPVVYHTAQEVPEWARQSVTRLMEEGVLRGDEKGDLNLSQDMARMLVILERRGRTA